MKKQLAVLVTAVMLSFSMNGGIVLADTVVQPTEVTAEANNQNTEGAVTSETNVTDTTVVSIGDDTVVVDEDGQEVDPGTLPDSPLSWLEELIEKIKVALAGNPIDKAQLIVDQATEDLSEATELAKEGEDNGDQIEETLNSYTTKVEKALEFLEQVNDTDSEEYQKLEDALTKVNANNVIVLGGLLEKLPPQAAEKVALNIVRAMEKAIAKAEKMEKVKATATDTDTDTDADTNTDADEEATTENSTDVTNADTITNTQVDEDLSGEATKELKTFAEALGLKKAPQGYAYGYYYKHDKEAKEAAKAVFKGQKVTEQTEQQVEQAETTQEQTNVQKAQQTKKEEVKSSSKQENNRHNKGENGKNHDRD